MALLFILILVAVWYGYKDGSIQDNYQDNKFN